MPSESSKTVKATQTSIRILEELHKRERAGVTEIADALDFSKANVHKHLATLEQSEFVVKREEKYSLSCRFLELGMENRRSQMVYQHATPHIETLAGTVGNTTYFAIEEHQKVVYLGISIGADGIGSNFEGNRFLLSETASGQVILAFSNSDPESESHGQIESADPHGIDIESVRSSGVAIRTNTGDYSEIAVPVQFPDGELVGSVGLFTPPQRHAELENKYQKLLKSTSEQIAKQISWNQ